MNRGEIHHANLLIGTPEEGEKYLFSLCSEIGTELRNNPDFFPFKMDVFGIEEARQLKSLSSRKGILGTKIFLISSPKITLEAQNALLKTFEDPFPVTLFFLTIRDESSLIPTLRSRMQLVRMEKGHDLISQDDIVEKFLTSPLKARLSFVKDFVEEEKNLLQFLDDLMLVLRSRKDSNHLLEKVYNIRRLTEDSEISPRLIMEHLSLVL